MGENEKMAASHKPMLRTKWKIKGCIKLFGLRLKKQKIHILFPIVDK